MKVCYQHNSLLYSVVYVYGCIKLLQKGKLMQCISNTVFYGVFNQMLK